MYLEQNATSEKSKFSLAYFVISGIFFCLFVCLLENYVNDFISFGSLVIQLP